MVKKFKYRFYIKELLIWICKPAKNADSDQYKYSNYGIGPTQWLDDTTLTAEAIYPINFTQANKRFVLNLQYSRSNSFLFVNATKIYQFKAKGSVLKDYVLCLGNISKDFTIDNMKKNSIKRTCKFFFDDFNPTDNNDILDIHKYLIKRT